MRFLITMNMPSYSGNLVHQMTVEHSSNSLEEFMEALTNNDYVVVEEFYKDTRPNSDDYYSRGFNSNNGVTEHSVIFPNVGSWIQSAVIIMTPGSVTLRSPQLLSIIAWDLLAGHPCRPNYSWDNNTYTCRTCSGRYTTD